jgi:replicative superfamily II helicase
VKDVIPDMFHHVFPFEVFNDVQTECIDAFTTRNNMVISAPTGSGKTALFELAICKEISSAIVAQDIHNPSSPRLVGKIVYLAPTRSLCAEKEVEWMNKFTRFGLQIKHVFGDSFDAVRSPVDVVNLDMILCTPEKWDAMTRREKNQGHEPMLLVSSVVLLLVDEVHHISDSRGAALEAVIAGMMLASDKIRKSATSFRDQGASGQASEKRLRIIAASATIPNIDEIAVWLRTDTATSCKTFPESHRPVPLQTKVLGYSMRNQWTFAHYLDKRLLQVIMEYSNNRPALVFCTSRQSTHCGASALVGCIHSQASLGSTIFQNIFTDALSGYQKALLAEKAAQCCSMPNRDILMHGIAVHHSDIATQDRTLIENMFRQKLIRVLFATTTLAQGVNLPAHLVIIKSTSVYSMGTMQEYDRNTIFQMMGRAGRPQYDVKGVAVIMTENNKVREYERICAGEYGNVESQLEQCLPELLNAEVARYVIVDVPTAVLWYRCTFLFVRMKMDYRGRLQDLEADVKGTLVKILQDLAKYRMLSFDEDGFGLQPCPSGLVMSRLYMSLDTMKLFAKEAGRLTSPADALKLISKAKEFQECLCIRRSERKNMRKLNDAVRYPIKTKLKSTEENIYILLQANLGDCIDTIADDIGLKNMARKVYILSGRISKTLSSCILGNVDSATFTSMHAALQVSRALQVNSFWDGGHVVRQLEGVGPGLARLLINAGVQSISSLVQMGPRQIEKVLGKNPPFGDKLLRGVWNIPCFQVVVKELTASYKSGPGDSISSSLHICIQLQDWNFDASASSSKFGLAETTETSAGFVLVGAHGENVMFHEHFSLGKGKPITFMVPIPQARRRESCRRWIDVVVGPENYIGVDFHVRVRVNSSGHSYESGIQEESVFEINDGRRTLRRMPSLGPIDADDKFHAEKLSEILPAACKRKNPPDLRVQRIEPTPSFLTKQHTYCLEKSPSESIPMCTTNQITKQRHWLQVDELSDGVDMKLKKSRLAGTRLAPFFGFDDIRSEPQPDCSYREYNLPATRDISSRMNEPCGNENRRPDDTNDHDQIIELLENTQSSRFPPWLLSAKGIDFQNKTYNADIALAENESHDSMLRENNY